MDITLNWVDLSDNEDGFHIYRSIDGAAESLLVDAAKDASAFVDLSVKAGSYVYSVSAFNSAGESARISSNTVVVPPQAPLAPSNVTATLVP